MLLFVYDIVKNNYTL